MKKDIIELIQNKEYETAEKLLKDCIYDALNELADNGIPTEYADRVEKHASDI